MIPKVALFTALLVVCFSAATYNESLAKLMAGYAAITHCKDASVVGWSCKECGKLSKLVDVSSFSSAGIHRQQR